jgi:signal transduction histidine kinase
VEAGEDARAVQSLRDVSRMITGAAERARRMTFELRPAMLWHHGLVEALQHLLATMEQTLGLHTSLHVEGLDSPVETALEAILFRAVTAVLANVRQHAQASTVTVSLVHHDGELVASVRDDGRGFVVGSALGPGAPFHALASLMERLEAAGGSLTVTSSPGEGTAVRIALPVRQTPAV